MIPIETTLRRQEDGSYQYKDGYFLTKNLLKELVRDFQVDCHDGFVSNDDTYIDEWLKNHNAE